VISVFLCFAKLSIKQKDKESVYFSVPAVFTVAGLTLKLVCAT